MRGNHICTYATDQGLGFAPQSSSSGTGRVAKPTQSGSSARVPRNVDVQARLERLETLLEKAVSTNSIPTRPPQQQQQQSSQEPSRQQEPESGLTPASNAGSSSSHGAGIQSDNQDGTLLLEDGQSQFVSSLHWALLADEVSSFLLSCSDALAIMWRMCPV